jgi:hypothetical protein
LVKEYWYSPLNYGVFGCEKKVKREKYVRENMRREKEVRNRGEIE